ncbi:peptide chain release factor N(5)-glutamine methyltransferase [Hyphobacterium sp.]|uniref:peptide chain release factor N(5)-glutamine methyltransferase n=1 Tax=Hyphobacterium sp. TaxID=2004662 RepID=UPI003BA8C275
MAYSQAQTAAWLARLKAAGIDEASFDLRHILLAAINAEMADSMVTRRVNREPLSHILGDKPFWTLDLKVTPDVLTPRADTETLVEVVLKQIDDWQAALRLADFGTGSGAILLALVSELPNSHGIGIDLSESALAIARENAVRNQLSDRVQFQTGDWAAGLADQSVDIAVSNPPYIASAVLAALDPEVKDHEPHLALDGGADGLNAYRLLMPQLFRILVPGGLMAVEIGHDQAGAVSELARSAGFADARTARDLAGNDRTVWARKREK